MKITIETLTEKGACAEGIKLFQRYFPRGLDLEWWTRENQIRVIKTRLREYIGWAWRNSILPQWSMSRADLRGADLRGADLRRADFSGADLRGADLRGADFGGADLRRADFGGADLSRADFSGADLRNADLRGIILENKNENNN